MKPSVRACRSSLVEPSGAGGTPPRRPLSPREESAARSLIRAVIEEVPARLLEAALFGSRARGTAHPDSDLDVLLVYRHLPPDREPQAGIAEDIAAGIGARTGIPLNVWSVSLSDTRPGARTPMLVDAFADAVPLWCRDEPLRPIPFCPADALHCTEALQRRVAEGSTEFQERLRSGDIPGAARRSRDDIVRLCTGLLLLDGVTRPRRADAVLAAAGLLSEHGARAPMVDRVLEWAASSYGSLGSDESRAVYPPEGGVGDVATVIDHLTGLMIRKAALLSRRVDSSQAPF